MQLPSDAAPALLLPQLITRVLVSVADKQTSICKKKQ